MTDKKTGYVNTVNDASVTREFRNGKEVTKGNVPTQEHGNEKKIRNPKSETKKEVTSDADKT